MNVFFKQWYDRAAQPQNMTFSQRTGKSYAEKSYDINIFQVNFHFTSLE